MFADIKHKKIYFLGIGGIGMSALARYFVFKGFQVYGYDRTRTELTNVLENEGMHIHYEDDIQQIPSEIDFVVSTPAVPSENAELKYLKQKNIPVYKRAQVLGMLSKSYKTLACAGTHGKTTTSTMLAHLLHCASVGCSAFLGGIARNYQTNILHSDTSEFMVAEADEFDRSFLQLFPHIAVVTSIDADHLDIYGSKEVFREGFEKFVENIKDNGYLIIKKGISLKNAYTEKYKTYTYAINEQADFYANNLQLVNGLYRFDFHYSTNVVQDIVLGIPGLYNVENAVAAIGAAILCGITPEEIKHGMQTFEGVKRRFEIRYNKNGKVYIDDYAHHPEELNAAIKSARAMFPDKKLTGIFQPHLYSRTRDFAKDFGQSLAKLDEVILLPIYPARELPIEGITSDMLLNLIGNANKQIKSKQDFPQCLENRNIEVLITMGAGDIDMLALPIENYFKEKYK